MPVLVGEVVHLLGRGLGGVAEDELPVAFADGQVPALAVVDGAAAQFGGVGGAGRGEPARQAGIRDGPEVVPVGDAGVAETLLDETLQQVLPPQGGVEVAVAGWAPFQRRVLRPLHRGQVVCPEFRFLVLQKTERQVVDGKVGVTLQVGQGVGIGAEGVHEQQRQRGVPVTPGCPHLPHDEVQEVQAVTHLEEVLGPVQPHRRAEPAVELDHDGGADRFAGLAVADLDVVQHRRVEQGFDAFLPDQPGLPRFQQAVIVREHPNRAAIHPCLPHLAKGGFQTLL